MAYPGFVILFGGTESVSRLVQWLVIGRAWIWRKCSKKSTKRRPLTRSPRLFLIPHRSRKFTAQNIALIEYSRYPLFAYGTCGLTYVRPRNKLCSICSNSSSMVFWIRAFSLWRWASSPAHSKHGLSERSWPVESFSSSLKDILVDLRCRLHKSTYFTSNTASTSTAAPVGNDEKPSALRA